MFERLSYCRNKFTVNPKIDSPWSWFVTLSCFLAHAVTFGVTYAFGIFYVALLQEFPGKESQAAWIVSINLSVVMILSPMTISLCRRFTPRVVCCCGVMIASTAFYLASMATSMYILYLTFGIMYGIAISLTYLPTLLVVKTNFKRHLAVAYGIGIAGSGFGAIVFSLLISSLVETRGWRGALHVLSYLTLGLIVFGLILFPSVQESQSTDLKSKEASLSPKKAIFRRIRISIPPPWRNKAFVMSAVAFFLTFFVNSIIYCHLVNFAVKQGLDISTSEKLPLFQGVGSTVGRLIIGWVSAIPRINQLYVSQAVLLVLCVAITLCPLASSAASLICFAVVFGVFDGAIVVLIPIVVDYVSPNQAQALQGLGNLFATLSIPYALGSPFAGWLFTITGSYYTVFFGSGAVLFVASCALSLAHLLRSLPDPATTVDILKDVAVLSVKDCEPNNPVNPKSNGLMKSRMCSLLDLSVELYSGTTNTTADKKCCSYCKDVLLYVPSVKFTEQNKSYKQNREKKVSVDNILSNHLYTDIHGQISGLTQSGQNTGLSFSATAGHAPNVVSVKCNVSSKDRMIDTSSADTAGDSLRKGCFNISVDDSGYASATATASFEDSDSYSCWSQYDRDSFHSR